MPDIFTSDVILAFGLTLFAGLATGIGSILAFFTKRTNTKFLVFSLGFSAGVMLYVSMIEIFPKSFQSLAKSIESEQLAYFYTTLGFFGGVFFIWIIDKLVPSFENPHELKEIEDIPSTDESFSKNKSLLRMGSFSALAIAIHNFPEGLATFTAALQDPALGISIAVAVAIHNIPEGIAVSVPVYYATGNRRKAFVLSFLSGLAEPLGAIIGFTILAPFMNDVVFGILFASVAGIMTFISLDELLPTAEKYGDHHLAIFGVISGMAIMATSLVLFV
jgi:ZIP family zinc transporter